MKKRILLTGGAGFVGSYLARALIEKGFQVTIIDDLSNGKRRNLLPGADFIKLDISDEKKLEKLSGRHFGSIIHCAAQSSNAISFKDPMRDMRVNQVGTLNLLNFCLKQDIKRFIFTSSMSAYGQPLCLPTGEAAPLNPDSFYGVHKAASEHYIRIFSQQHGIKYTIFRLYTTYGFGQNLRNLHQGLLSIYLSYILQTKTLVVKGSGDRTRDIIHVSDVVNAIMLSLNNHASFNKIYNLGTGKSLKIEKIIEDLTTGLGYKKGGYPVRYESNTPGDPFDTLADIRRARKDLIWRPKVSAEQGIKLTLKSYKETRGLKE